MRAQSVPTARVTLQLNFGTIDFKLFLRVHFVHLEKTGPEKSFWQELCHRLGQQSSVIPFAEPVSRDRLGLFSSLCVSVWVCLEKVEEERILSTGRLVRDVMPSFFCFSRRYLSLVLKVLNWWFLFVQKSSAESISFKKDSKQHNVTSNILLNESHVKTLFHILIRACRTAWKRNKDTSNVFAQENTQPRVVFIGVMKRVFW